jgi:hypothetical protein
MKRVALIMLATMAGFVNKGERMKHRITTGIFSPSKGKPLSFMVVMICPDATCAHVWEASCISTPCPRCGNRDVVPASKWNLDEQAILKMGKLPEYLPYNSGRPDLRVIQGGKEYGK